MAPWLLLRPGLGGKATFVAVLVPDGGPRDGICLVVMAGDRNLGLRNQDQSSELCGLFTL